MILYIENPEDSTQKLLELVNKYIKVGRYKINIQKLAAFLYTKKEISEKKISFKIALKKNTKKTLRNKPDQRGERLIC